MYSKYVIQNNEGRTKKHDNSTDYKQIFLINSQNSFKSLIVFGYKIFDENNHCI